MSSSKQYIDDQRRADMENQILLDIRKRAAEMAPGTAMAIKEAYQELSEIIDDLPLTKGQRQTMEDRLFTLTYIFTDHGTQNS